MPPAIETFPPATLFIGDPFLTEGKLKTFISQLESKIKGAAALESRWLSESGLEEILTQLRTPSFFAATQIFRIRDSKDLRKDDLELLESYLESPAESAYLVFEAEEMERSHPLLSLIQKKGKVVFVENAEVRSAARRFIREKLKNFGKAASPAVLARLDAQAMESPIFIDSVLDQLVSYAGNQKEITEEMLNVFSEKWAEPNVFQLTEAIAAKKSSLALDCLKRILEENDKDLVGIIGLLHWQVRRLWQAKVLSAERRGESEILRACKVYGPQAQSFLRQARMFSRAQIERSLDGLFQLDWKIKTGRVNGASALEAWVVEAAS